MVGYISYKSNIIGLNPTYPIFMRHGHAIYLNKVLYLLVCTYFYVVGKLTGLFLQSNGILWENIILCLLYLFLYLDIKANVN